MPLIAIPFRTAYRRLFVSALAFPTLLGCTSAGAQVASSDPAVVFCAAVERQLAGSVRDFLITNQTISGAVVTVKASYVNSVGLRTETTRECSFGYDDVRGGFYMKQADYVPQVDMNAPLDTKGKSEAELRALLAETYAEQDRAKAYLQETAAILSISTALGFSIKPETTALRH